MHLNAIFTPENAFYARALAGVEMPGLQRSQQGFGFIFGRLHHDPAAEPILTGEMCVIHGDQRYAPAIGQKLVRQHAATAAIRPHLAGVVIDFHRMGRCNAMAIGWRQPIPAGMGNRDKGASIGTALRECRAILLRRGWRKIQGQANGQDMPNLPK